MSSLAPKRTSAPLLTLVPANRQPASALAYWHLLSLDAPTVAASWTVFIARCVGLTLPWTAPAAMFIAVWMLYAADRLLDARPQRDGATPPELEERHRFHHLYRTRFLYGIAFAAVALVLLIHRLNAEALHLFALLSVLLSAWLLLIHARAAHSLRLPKELAVGIFFPAAVFIPTVARDPQLQLALFPSAVLLAGVCTLNCLFLYAWEHPIRQPLAHATTRWATRHLALLAAALIAAATSVAIFSDLRAPAICCTLSAALLVVLNAQRRRFHAVILRAAADLVLLTPLLFLAHR